MNIEIKQNEIKKLKEFNIPVTWKMTGELKIIANTLEEAMRIALTEREMPNERNSDYIDDTARVDFQSPAMNDCIEEKLDSNVNEYSDILNVTKKVYQELDIEDNLLEEELMYSQKTI